MCLFSFNIKYLNSIQKFIFWHNSKSKIVIQFIIKIFNKILNYFLIQFSSIFYKTALTSAAKNQNADIIKLLLENKKLDPNIPYRISTIFLNCVRIIILMKFKIKHFNKISKIIF